MAARFSEVAHTMINKKQSLTLLSAVALSVSLSACSVFDWLIYKPDIPQGNYMEPQQVEKLRIDMTKEQAEYILGRPVLRDSFADDTWYYVYHYKSGRDASITHKELILHFTGDKLTAVNGDYELSKEFDTPLEQSSLPTGNKTELVPQIPAQRPDAKPLVKENQAEAQVQKPIK
ncbi:MAG: outer membrane protein assembly factor BamE [Gammaproteobacteria bacterium]|nr:outer membrane protein assembly factor BamE [Gammaproteobacteria bacterium]MBU1478387.1 outer membrane protein assembly factor BamE [Gammaproteobacteria bacterium]MBU2001925.1 outer membrane protein assembly factor BamE [Gammaproteobacteria bacterium]MBU2131049.1 outer membrane protein assembly factor BamE [Gammaproteobacteria bacterium]MBU2188811.1 outer membrane protein assembly factor BamE [Gammaproteobacteria bacterium]